MHFFMWYQVGLPCTVGDDGESMHCCLFLYVDAVVFFPCTSDIVALDMLYSFFPPLRSFSTFFQ